MRPSLPVLLSVATATAALLGSAAAAAATFTYTSQPLQVASEGGNGATQVVVVFTGKAPLKGHCTRTQAVASYDDGAHTLATLQASGFVLTKNLETDTGWVRMTYATVCLGKDGHTVNGQYQVWWNYPSYYGGDFYANNLGYYVPGDLVQEDLYFGGEIPQTYSNTSTTPGTWVITR